MLQALRGVKFTFTNTIQLGSDLNIDIKCMWVILQVFLDYNNVRTTSAHFRAVFNTK